MSKIKSIFGPEPVPFALEWDAWDRFYADYRRAHPVKFFVYKLVPRKCGDLRHRCKNLYWWFQHRFNPRHRYNIVRTGLKPGYHEYETRLLHGNFSLLCDFMERSGAAEHFDWQHGEPHRKAWDEFTDLYRWWKHARPKELAEIDAMWRGGDGAKLHEAHSRERALVEAERKNLHRLIDVLGFMWT